MPPVPSVAERKETKQNKVQKCPICGEIMSSSESFKYPNGKQKVYYHLRCKNHNCSGFGLHYNTEKIETKLKQKN